jgi:hypothetical protein
MKTNETIETQVRNLKPGFSTKPMTFGQVSTWFERSGDGRTVRLIRETKGRKSDGFISKTEVVKTSAF